MPLIQRALDRLIGSRRAKPVEQKASAAGSLIALQTMGEPVWSPRDYASFAREGFQQNAIVHRCVRMVAEAAASIPLLLYEGDAEIERHPLVELLRRPAEGMTSVDLLERWYGFLLVSGNAYLEAVAIGGELRELHALRPDRMRIVPGADGWPAAWEYEVAGRVARFEGDVVEGVSPILHLRLFHPLNDHYGLSPIEAAATAIDIHNEASRWNKALLDNSARPSGALVYAAANGQMTGEQFERLKRELEASYQGAGHAGRPLLLEGGLDWKPLSLTPKDMDFIEAKNSAAREIALALGVPPMLLGIPGDNTFANYQEAQRAFWRQTVLPLVGRTTRALSAWLAPAYGGALELRADLDQVEALAGEREALWARLEAASFLTQDEKRSAAGYGEAEGGGAGAAKFNPNHDALGRFTTADGAGGGGEGGGEFVLVGDDGDDRLGTRIDVLAEDALGGHTYERHIGKSESFLKARVIGSRTSFGILTVGEKRAGSFSSVEAANKLVSATVSSSENATKIGKFVRAEFPFLLPVMYLYAEFKSPTGYEAYVKNDRAKPEIRDTFSVTVSVRRSSVAEKGFIVQRAWPSNKE